LWGASFPMALAAAAAPGQDPGRLISGVYAANTSGAIAGALVFSLFLIPAFGTAGAQQALILLAGAAALSALVPVLKRTLRSAPIPGFAAVAVPIVLAFSLASTVSPMPWIVVAFAHQTPTWPGRCSDGVVKNVPTTPGKPDVFCTYLAEGINASVAVTVTKDGLRSFHSAGKVQASTLPVDMRAQRMLGHIPALIHK